MPRPIAAGVFGIARTIAHGSALSRNPSVLPAMIETARVPSPASGLSVGTTVAASCGLIAMTMTLASVDRCRIDAHAARLQRRDLGGRLRLEDGDLVRIEPEREPAFQHRAAHLAGADQHERAGEVLRRCGHRSQPSFRGPRSAGPESITTSCAVNCTATCAHRSSAAMDSRAHALCGDAGRNDGGDGYASPDVSNIAASSASRADFPAQTTNWNAWK